MKKSITNSIFVRMLIPTILTNLVTAVGGFSDTVIVGNYLGEKALSSVTFNSPIFMVINTLAAILAVGGATAMSVDAGKGKRDTVNRIFSVCLCWGVIISAVMAILGVVFVDGLVAALGATGDVAVLVRSYAIVIVAFVPAFILNITFAFFVRNDGRPKLAMAGMLSAIVINIVFDIVFVGFCGMGVAGAAWAMVMSQTVSAIIIGTHFASKKCTLHFSVALNPSMLGRIFKNGIGTSMTFIYQTITMLVLNHIIMSRAGTAGMTVYTVVFNICLIAMSVFEGLSQTIQPIISVYHGEKNEIAIKQTMKMAIRTGSMICGVIILLLEVFPGAIASIFGISGGEIMTGAMTATRIVAPSIFFMTVNVLLSYYYQSRENRILPFAIVMSRNLIMLLSGVSLLSLIFGINGVWAGYLFAELMTFAVICIMTAIMRKKDHALKGLLLTKDTGNVFARDIGQDREAVQTMLSDANEFLRGHENIRHIAADKAILAMEELTYNIVEYGKAKDGIRIQVLLTAEEDRATLIIRDNAQIFDPTGFNRERQELTPPDKLGLFLVKKTATCFDYMPTLGFNRTVLVFENGEKA